MPLRQIEGMRGRLASYARLVEHMIRRSWEAWGEMRPELLQDIVQKDEARANSLEMELEEEGTAFIAQHQPMGRELRAVLTMLRMTSDLERMADHAVNIAEAVANCIARSPLRPEGLIVRMFEETLKMLDCGVQAFTSGDAGLGRRVCETDSVVDALADGILDQASASMTRDPSTIAWNLATLKIAANLERIADLSTNMGEDVVYSTEGRVIKHHHDEEDR